MASIESRSLLQAKPTCKVNLFQQRRLGFSSISSHEHMRLCVPSSWCRMAFLARPPHLRLITSLPRSGKLCGVTSPCVPRCTLWRIGPRSGQWLWLIAESNRMIPWWVVEITYSHCEEKRKSKMKLINCFLWVRYWWSDWIAHAGESPPQPRVWLNHWFKSNHELFFQCFSLNNWRSELLFWLLSFLSLAFTSVMLGQRAELGVSSFFVFLGGYRARFSVLGHTSTSAVSRRGDL